MGFFEKLIATAIAAAVSLIIGIPYYIIQAKDKTKQINSANWAIYTSFIAEYEKEYKEAMERNE